MKITNQALVALAAALTALDGIQKSDGTRIAAVAAAAAEEAARRADPAAEA